MANSSIFAINKAVIDGETMDEDITSTVVDISEITCFAVHSVWTGTPAGNIIVQVSNDNSNWFAIDTQAAGGAASNDMVNVSGAGYKYVRVFYDFSSSTGTLTTYICGKYPA